VFVQLLTIMIRGSYVSYSFL